MGSVPVFKLSDDAFTRCVYDVFFSIARWDKKRKSEKSAILIGQGSELVRGFLHGFEFRGCFHCSLSTLFCFVARA